MKKKIVALLFLSFACVANVNAGERLTNDELKEFYTDKTLTGVHFKLGPGKTYFGADGSAHSKADSGNERIGKWWIDEDSNKRCIRWNGKNKDFCHYTERNDDGSHTLIHGKNGKRLVEIEKAESGNQM